MSGIHHDTEVSIHAALQKLLIQGVEKGVPSISAYIKSSNGTLWSGVAGVPDVETTQPIADNHVYGIGSISKVFLSLTTLQLIDEKKLGLEDPIEKYIANDVYKGIPHAAKATIGQLLNHTSGIPSWEDDSKWILEGRGNKLDPSKIWTKIETLEYIRYESNTARDLGNHIERIRRDYSTDMHSELMAERQRGVLVYLIDKLALRSSSDEEFKQASKNFNWCSLKYENVTLEEPQTVVLDLGNHTIALGVESQVFKNLKIFKKSPKTIGDKIFDRYGVSYLFLHIADF